MPLILNLWIGSQPEFNARRYQYILRFWMCWNQSLRIKISSYHWHKPNLSNYFSVLNMCYMTNNCGHNLFLIIVLNSYHKATGKIQKRTFAIIAIDVSNRWFENIVIEWKDAWHFFCNFEWQLHIGWWS